MANDFKNVILTQLGDPPPPTRGARDAVYQRIRAEFDAMYAGETAAVERAAHALALQHAIDAIEAELFMRETLQGAALATPAPGPGTGQQRFGHGARARPFNGRATFVAAVAAVLAILAAGAWYVLFMQRDRPIAERPAASQTGAGIAPRNDSDLAASDKARSFLEALRNGDAGTVAFLLKSGYRPTRVELRAALLQVRYTPQIKAATMALADDIGDIACSFTTFPEVRKPLTRSSLFDAEDAFAIMKQVGQDEWRSMCLGERGKWREALAKIERQNAAYNKPEAEKKSRAEACIRRFGTEEAMDRWERAHCTACPESHSSCEAYCPQAPRAADAEEARFFSFNRSDMSMATTTAQSQARSRAELYCNLQHLARPTDSDLTNLQRFRSLVLLFD